MRTEGFVGLGSRSSGPKRSESMTASGRAPMVKMSRRMPPTPVAAPWIRLDVAGVVVRFDLEGAGPAVADVDDAGVFARPLDDAAADRCLGGQALEVDAGGLVGAVLAPHHAVDAQFGEEGRAAEGRSMRSYSSGVMLCCSSSSGVIVAGWGICRGC